MAKKRFKANIFSLSSIEKMKKELLNYQSELYDKTKLLCQRLAELGADVARAEIANLDAVFTGELFRSINFKQKSGMADKVVFVVVADSDHAVFVEFGTGIVGKSSPYPVPFPDGIDWEYASGTTIRQLKDGRYGWFYYRDGQWYFTEGMQSRPFMHGASIEMQRQVVKIAKEVFR